MLCQPPAMTLSKTIAAVLVGAGVVSARSGAGTLLDPVQPVLRPDGALAKDPLAHLGGNGPWTAGKSRGCAHELP